MGDRIRLRYTGILGFASRLFSMLTGVAFVVMVTRNVPVAEFGIWQYISLITGYLLFPNFIVGGWSGWTVRFIARGMLVGKTSVLVSFLLSIIASIAFVGISIWSVDFFNTSIIYFALAMLSIPPIYLASTLEAILQGYEPHVVYYGTIIFEVVKLSAGIIAVFYFRQGLVGVLTAMLIAYIAQDVFLFLRATNMMGDRVEWKVAAEWLKTGWLPAFRQAPATILGLDMFLVTLFLASSEPIAFWRAAQIIYGTITMASALASAIYPKLLKDGSGFHVEATLKLVLLFAMPMTIGALVLSEPLLGVLGQEYIASSGILRVGALVAFVNLLSSVFHGVATGAEKVDMDGRLKAKELLKSTLFKIPLVMMLVAFMYLLSVCFIATIFQGEQNARLSVPLYANFAALVAYIVVLVYTYWSALRKIKFSFPASATIKYLTGCAFMIVFLLVFYPSGSVRTIATALAGGGVYFVVLLLIDKEVRQLFMSGLNFLKGKVARILRH
ncbi:MAG: hypothetical protein QXO01_00855 [Nitrososphaerota archaeon]